MSQLGCIHIYRFGGGGLTFCKKGVLVRLEFSPQEAKNYRGRPACMGTRLQNRQKGAWS